jgi:DNA-binding winged helix-turn-helix (wHTH) protein
VRYQFDDCVLDTTRYELTRSGELVHVEPQVFDVLAYLVEHRDRVVTKVELLDAVWNHQFVTESALTTRIKQGRQAVGDDGRQQRTVQTVHGRGYRFVAAVDEVADATERPVLPVPAELRQEIRFCTASDGTQLAYATVGSGPPLVRAAHWITHLDYDWQSGTTSAAAGSRTMTSRTSRSPHGCRTSRRSSTISGWSDSRSWASPRAARSQWPTRRVIRSG